MQQYSYEARARSGKVLKGKLSSMDRASVVEELRKRGLTVLSVEEIRYSVLNVDIYIGNPVKSIHFIIFCRQFATLMRAGITLVDATAILAEQTESKPLRKALLEVNASVLRGNPFSQAAQEHKRIFPPIFVSMMRAGEETGDVEGTLERLAIYFEKAHTTKEKVKSAMTYPIAVGILSVCAIIYLLQGVVPQFVTMFASFDAELPAITQIVLSLSKSISTQWYIWLLVIAAIFIGYHFVRQSDKGSYMIDYAKLKIPIFGKLLQKGAIAQMTRTLSSLYASSVPVLQALSIVENVVNNKVISGVVRQASESLRNGSPMSEPLKRSWVFPPLVTQMMSVGEETGALDQMLEKVADFYEGDVDNTVDRLKSLIEPLLIVVLAGVVGFIVLAILLPMFALYGSV